MMVSIDGPMIVPNFAIKGMMAITIMGEAAFTSRSLIQTLAALTTFGLINSPNTKA